LYLVFINACHAQQLKPFCKDFLQELVQQHVL